MTNQVTRIDQAVREKKDKEQKSMLKNQIKSTIARSFENKLSNLLPINRQIRHTISQVATKNNSIMPKISEESKRQGSRFAGSSFATQEISSSSSHSSKSSDKKKQPSVKSRNPS